MSVLGFFENNDYFLGRLSKMMNFRMCVTSDVCVYVRHAY